MVKVTYDNFVRVLLAITLIFCAIMVIRAIVD